MKQFKVFKNDRFNCMVVRVKCKSEINGIQIQIVCCYFGKHANNINLILPELVSVLVLVHNYIFCNCLLLRCCDRCDEWFHGDCIGITKLEAKEIKQYYCAQCLGESLSELFDP